MREYKLPSGRASIETTGGLRTKMEFTWPSKASERNLALREALEQCLHLSAQCGVMQLRLDTERESMKLLVAERDKLAEIRKVWQECDGYPETLAEIEKLRVAIEGEGV